MFLLVKVISLMLPPIFLHNMQVASQVAALDIGYKPGVSNMTEKPKLLFLLGAVSLTICLGCDLNYKNVFRGHKNLGALNLYSFES